MRRRAVAMVATAACALTLVAPVRRLHAQDGATHALRGVAIDERLAADFHLTIGDTITLGASPDSIATRVVIAAIAKRGADPSEIARSEYRLRMHLDQLETLVGYGDRVDRYAVLTRGGNAMPRVVDAVNGAAFGFRAYPSRDIAVGTSKTFAVVSRFHRAIGVITIVASAIFLLCIMLLKVEERRRDVAALRLAGISRATIVRAITLEATLISVLGSIAGIGIGSVGASFINAHYQAVYRTPLRFAIITPEAVALAVTLSIVLGVGAGMLASLRLVRTPPLALMGR